MSRRAEARLWQWTGAIVGIAGGAVFGYDGSHYGLAPIAPRALALGMLASFLVLAGAACYLAGRALHVEGEQLTARESRLWKILAVVCVIAGAAVVAMAWRSHELLLDRFAMGTAGAFAIMLGVLCLTGERVMIHMHDALMAEKAKRASAN